MRKLLWLAVILTGCASSTEPDLTPVHRVCTVYESYLHSVYDECR